MDRVARVKRTSKLGTVGGTIWYTYQVTHTSAAHLEFYHRPGEPFKPLSSCCVANAIRPSIFVDMLNAFSPGLECDLLLVQPGNLCCEFCLEVDVERVAVQDK